MLFLNCFILLNGALDLLLLDDIFLLFKRVEWHDLPWVLIWLIDINCNALIFLPIFESQKSFIIFFYLKGWSSRVCWEHTRDERLRGVRRLQEGTNKKYAEEAVKRSDFISKNYKKNKLLNNRVRQKNPSSSGSGPRFLNDTYKSGASKSQAAF